MATSEPLAPTEAALAALAARPAIVCELPREARDALLAYLEDWGPPSLLLACADALIEARPRLTVSSLDRRARALLALGQPQAAVVSVQQRLDVKDSFTGRALLARVLLAAGDDGAARDIAAGMTVEEPTSAMGWQALAELELAAGDGDAALLALRRLDGIVPQHRAYLLGMSRLYAAGEDWVTATSFAVLLLEATDDGASAYVAELRRLHALFLAAGEGTRATDVGQLLAQRQAAAGDELLAALGEVQAEPTAAGTQVPEAAPAQLTVAADVPVSAEERDFITGATRRLFGFSDLMPGQLASIACALRGESVLTILPTGGGKSLCYQLPAFMQPSGTTLVVSPLIALMQDQWQHVPEPLRPLTTFINSQVEGDELGRRMDAVAAGAYRLVYVAPERLRQPPFIAALCRAGVTRLVIDEAHCVSVWGHDFRPDYLALAGVREQLGRPPVLGLTATAPERVRRDILRQLGDMRIVAAEPCRPNLTFSVIHAADADEKYGAVVNFCAATAGTGIVYAGTQDRCEELAAILNRQGIAADYYHAGSDHRALAQERWMAGETRVMVATSAFGLGVDKADVRFVLHFLPPDSLESYYQEAGRAGRDGLPARCTLLFAASADKATLTRHVKLGDVSIDSLRAVYAAVRARLNGATAGRVAMADLLRDLAGDDATALRVGLGILEQAGLLSRGPDVPRTVTVMLTAAATHAMVPELQAFAAAAHLAPQQRLTLDPVATARAAGLPPEAIEAMLLAWQEHGWLRYRPSGRDLLIVLPRAPEGANRRVAELLEMLASYRRQRVSDIVAYTQTRRCRHGYLSQYLGGAPISGCGACDNCVAPSPLPNSLPSEPEQALTVLRCLAASRSGWGRTNLVRILRGEATAPPAAQGREGFGALGYRSPSALESLIDRLETQGLIEGSLLDHGGTVLALTAAGAEAMRRPALLSEALAPPSRVASMAPRPAASEPVADPEDDGLFEALRAWRAAVAQADAVPPFVIFHDKHLRAIAAARPDSLAALAEVKGVGPAKLAKYGEAVLQVVQESGATEG